MDSAQLVVGGEIRGQLNWTETNIGLTASLQCPCAQASISVQATRTCGGNFIDGGQWMMSDTTACEFDDVALQLCSATVRVAYQLCYT